MTTYQRMFRVDILKLNVCAPQNSFLKNLSRHRLCLRMPPQHLKDLLRFEQAKLEFISDLVWEWNLGTFLLRLGFLLSGFLELLDQSTPAVGELSKYSAGQVGKLKSIKLHQQGSDMNEGF